MEQLLLSAVEKTEIYAAEPLASQRSTFEVYIIITKLKTYKLPDID
jgi:hypothetical protein